jgi:hypothetical protein
MSFISDKPRSFNPRWIKGGAAYQSPKLPDLQKGPFDRMLVGQYRLIDRERLPDMAGSIGDKGYDAVHTLWVDALHVEKH